MDLIIDYTHREFWENGDAKLYVADWFYHKNLDNFYNKSGHLVAKNEGFKKEWIVKESEKAICVELPLVDTLHFEDTAWTRKVWIPKSCVVTRTYNRPSAIATFVEAYDEHKYF